MLDNTHSAYIAAEAFIDKYLARLQQVQGTTQEVAEKTASSRTAGAWSSIELIAMLGGGNIQERTAKASEQIVVNTKETNRQLRKMKNEGSTTLYYA